MCINNVKYGKRYIKLSKAVDKLLCLVYSF